MNAKSLVYFVTLFFSIVSVSQESINFTNLEHNVVIDSVYSKTLNTYRVISINLPKDYNKNEKHPVLYTLDAEWMFEPTVSEVRTLSNFDVIPKSIVIGIYHKNRNNDLGIDWKTGKFEDKSLAFYNFIKNELIPFINNKYTTSKFNVLVGHSNGATFSHQLINQKNQPFRGFVTLSQNLFGNQQKEFETLISTTLDKPTFYFVASGTRDATPRVKSGEILDSIFNAHTNTKIIAKQRLYNADHYGVAARGLKDGIAHMFSEYIHYNDWDDKMIDSLRQNNVGPLDFLNQHSKKIHEIYGIDFKVTQDDLGVMQLLAKTEKDFEDIQKIEIKILGKDDQFYAIYAQYYEYAKMYEKALEFWNTNLNNSYEHNEYFFYYKRPIELIYKKMKDPKRAIKYIRTLKKTYKDQELYLNYYFAKISSENNIQKKEGLKFINDCIKNYKKNKVFELEKAVEIKKSLSSN